MTLLIGGLDVTPFLQEGTMILRHYGTLRSSFRATLFYEAIPKKFVKAGQEILIKEGDLLIWGGILVESEQICHSTKSFSMSLRGQGYEQILQRFCLPGIQLDGMTPSQAATMIFNTYLDIRDGLILGAIDEGNAPAYSHTFDPTKASAVFDRLAKENGFVWWINKDKTFYMKPQIPIKSLSTVIDLKNNPSNGLKDLQTLVYRQSTADFKNELIVYNRNNDVIGYEAITELLQEMGSRYGGGKYGAAISNSAVNSTAWAESVARIVLSSSPGLGEVEFTTDWDGFALGQNLQVLAPVCGIDSTKKFYITEISAVYLGDRFRYTVIAREMIGNTLTTARWENLLAGERTR
ncbi:MAG: hypothetical protein IIY12_04645 [Clostridia bacterium]|nr:hypothetical protein [Clostridia bacterium]MBQ1965712.1 hypothetical protein [Clostridia bacterium]